MNAEPWPDLLITPWDDTRYALHMWTQIVGKVRLALEPMVNHWWQVTLYVSARGLTTSLMHAPGRGLEIEFDFVDQVLALRTTTGAERKIPLEPGSIANFYEATMRALADLEVRVTIVGRPVEVEVAIPFAEDTAFRAYDPDAAHRFWRALAHADRVMEVFRSDFIGKVSPVHYFWGAADLAVTRFSGRTAPQHPGGVPNCPDWVQELAYSHEVSSCGFWPGENGEGMFYSYAYPEPPGFGARRVRPDAAHYDASVGEFLLPYESVRTAADPDATLLAFFRDTYRAAADLAAWPPDLDEGAHP
jgi:hypothetical protein